MVQPRWMVKQQSYTALNPNDIFRNVPQNLQVNCRTLPRLGHESFLPYPVQLVTATPCSLVTHSLVEQTTIRQRFGDKRCVLQKYLKASYIDPNYIYIIICNDVSREVASCSSLRKCMHLNA